VQHEASRHHHEKIKKGGLIRFMNTSSELMEHAQKLIEEKP